ncbi:MAG TPA: hypothetical protein VF680_01370 [Allosphingosinicella sp.]|jgi:hypothetical protein
MEAEYFGLAAYHLMGSMLDELETLHPGSSKSIVARAIRTLNPNDTNHAMVLSIITQLPAAKP